MCFNITLQGSELQNMVLLLTSPEWFHVECVASDGGGSVSVPRCAVSGRQHADDDTMQHPRRQNRCNNVTQYHVFTLCFK